ncbi:hypothetical protein QTP88_005462 [Uroleucon formosanum]
MLLFLLMHTAQRGWMAPPFNFYDRRENTYTTRKLKKQIKRVLFESRKPYKGYKPKVYIESYVCSNLKYTVMFEMTFVKCKNLP